MAKKVAKTEAASKRRFLKKAILNFKTLPNC